MKSLLLVQFKQVLQGIKNNSSTLEKRRFFLGFLRKNNLNRQEVTCVYRLWNLKKNSIYTNWSYNKKKHVLDNICLTTTDSRISIHELFRFIQNFSTIKGKNSEKKKQDYFYSFTSDMPIDEKHLVFKIITSNISIGMDLIQVKKIINHYLLSIGENIILQDNDRGQFNLAKTYRETIKEDLFVEPKYDGIRIMIKNLPTGISIVSRRGQDISNKLPDLVKKLKIGDHYIIDCELVLPCFHEFSLILRHKDKFFTNYQVIAFDLLRLNEQNLYEEPLFERKKKLSLLVDSLPMVEVVESIKYKKQEVPNYVQYLELLRRNWNDSEGVVIKTALGKYEPGKRSWIKLKRERETIDLVVLSRKKGRGKYMGVYCSFDLGINKGGKIYPFCNVGSGFSIDLLSQINNLPYWSSQCKEKPTISLIFEIAFDQIIVSQTEVGFTLRFPVFKRLRLDKKTASSLEEYVKT